MLEHIRLYEEMRKNNVVDTQTFLRWVKNIINTKVSMFKYENLPDGLTSQIIEECLLFANCCCFYKSDKLGLVMGYYTYAGGLDIYMKPTRVNVIAFNGSPIATNIPYKDIILARDNIMDIPPFVTLTGWIDKIIDTEKTIDIIMILLRFPTILSGDKTQALALQNLLKKAINYEGFVIGSSRVKDRLDQFDIKIPINPNELWTLEEKYIGKAYESIGIYNLDKKRERLVTEEISAENEIVDIIYQDMKNEREQFIEKINALGYNIKLVESYIENRKIEDKLDIDKEKQLAIIKEEHTPKVTGGNSNE